MSSTTEVFDGKWESANRCWALWAEKSGTSRVQRLNGPTPGGLPLALSLRPFTENPVILNAGDEIRRYENGSVRLILRHADNIDILTF